MVHLGAIFFRQANVGKETFILRSIFEFAAGFADGGTATVRSEVAARRVSIQKYSNSP